MKHLIALSVVAFIVYTTCLSIYLNLQHFNKKEKINIICSFVIGVIVTLTIFLILNIAY
jgi:hypothetical protein